MLVGLQSGGLSAGSPFNTAITRSREVIVSVKGIFV